MQKPNAILFDWDLTLSDSFKAIVKSYNHVLKQYGEKPWTEKQVRVAMAYSLRANFTKIFGEDKWEEAATIFRDYYAQIHIDNTKLLKGASELLKKWKDTYDCPFGVISNKTPRFLRAEIEAVGVSKYMDVIVGAGEASADKPAPAPILLAVEKLGLSMGKSIWYVGDMISDAKAGLAAGCTTMIVGEADEMIQAEKPDVYVSNLDELQKAVQENIM